jgi:hypothetical protein
MGQVKVWAWVSFSCLIYLAVFVLFLMQPMDTQDHTLIEGVEGRRGKGSKRRTPPDTDTESMPSL